MSALTTSTTPLTPVESLALLLRELRLPAFARYAVDVAQTAEREGWSYGRYLHHLAELEVEERRRRRIERLQRASNLPSEKTLATLDRKRLPEPHQPRHQPRRRPRLRLVRRLPTTGSC